MLYKIWNKIEFPLMALLALVASYLIKVGIGEFGILGPVSPWILTCVLIMVAHLTITSMSLGFHRQHTHHGVTFHPWVDGLMQIWLWIFTSMSKRDWVSVHAYHHAYSDTEKDPHSPVIKGLAHVFFLGVFDYTKAKNSPEVLKIRNRIPENRFEAFIHRHLFLGPIVLVASCLVLLGPSVGGAMALACFLISPLLAVGGVNALAHWFGYRNHKTSDNSRNLGFLFPLNWIICGELDHNNHHHFPASCSFRNRWYEFDIGFVYINVLAVVGLAKIKYVASLKGAKESLDSRDLARAL